MENKSSKGLRVFAIGFTVFILLVFSFVLLRTATRQILIKRMGITNGFTNLVLFDEQNLNEVPETDEEENIIEDIVIDWEGLYPFSGSEVSEIIAVAENKTTTEFEEKIGSIEGNITTYVTDYLPWYKNITELAGNYEQLVFWNFAPASEYNNVTVRSGGYLVGMSEKADVLEGAESLIELADFCNNQGTEFIYIQYPCKICVDEDSDISGTMDFSNQNADDFLSELKKNGVTTYDLRTNLHEEGKDHHSMFFNTDIHWKPQSGMWAAQHILGFLNESYNYGLNTEILDSSNFDEVVYPDWFLGSQGKKVTLSACEPDDISLFYPKFETYIHCEIPELGIDEYGGFDLLYNMNSIEEKDYYNKSPYHTYSYGNPALIKVENELVDDDHHLLIIHDSFTDCVIPFLSMGIKNLDAIDLRHFTGSLQSYIEQEKPDVVIVAYNAASGFTPKDDLSKHDDLFDFR